MKVRSTAVYLKRSLGVLVMSKSVESAVPGGMLRCLETCGTNEMESKAAISSARETTYNGDRRSARRSEGALRRVIAVPIVVFIEKTVHAHQMVFAAHSAAGRALAADGTRQCHHCIARPEHSRSLNGSRAKNVKFLTLFPFELSLFAY